MGYNSELTQMLKDSIERTKRQFTRLDLPTHPEMVPPYWGADFGAGPVVTVWQSTEDPSVMVANALKEERAKVRAALEAIKPMEEPYTRMRWADEQKGAKEMFAKVLKAIGGEA